MIQLLFRSRWECLCPLPFMLLLLLLLVVVVVVVVLHTYTVDKSSQLSWTIWCSLQAVVFLGSDQV